MAGGGLGEEGETQNRQPPALGTMVEMTGAFKGRKGMVIGDHGRTVLVRMKDGTKAEVAWEYGLKWTRAVPLKPKEPGGYGTAVTIKGIPHLEGVRGHVVSFVAVNNGQRTVTEEGVHYGVVACVVETLTEREFEICEKKEGEAVQPDDVPAAEPEPGGVTYGKLPIMLENLEWDPSPVTNIRWLGNMPERSPLPPAGAAQAYYYSVAECKDPYDTESKRGKMYSSWSQRGGYTGMGQKMAEAGQPQQDAAGKADEEDFRKRPVTALHQLILDDHPVKTRTVRTRPMLNAPVTGSITNREVLSVYIEYPGGDLPEGWTALSSGGFIKETCPGPTLRRLTMDCPCGRRAGKDLDSEEAARKHFEAFHPYEAYRLTVSGTIEEEEKRKGHVKVDEFMRPPPPAKPLPFQFTKPDPSQPFKYSQGKHLGLSPAWFDIRKPGAGGNNRRTTNSLYSLSRLPREQQ
eukprot:TRINITY_DN27591_c0_g1_i1.p1 TRINITY_DN27591_c0_g1~~TRINITY_DN27591_c0_g1_i1.p1  ORF type:complete len:477 (+),score=137.53 TRINITY_DN27591_c0_g1_i1:51-1433(+)